MNRLIMQQALDALNMACAKYGDVGNIHTDWGKWDAATTALREELAKPEQEPVAWMTNSEHEYSIDYKFNWLQTPLHNIPLYTAPPRKPWQGLTDDEVLTIWLSPDACKVPQCDKYHHFYVAIEAKLKDKNT